MTLKLFANSWKQGKIMWFCLLIYLQKRVSLIFLCLYYYMIRALIELT